MICKKWKGTIRSIRGLMSFPKNYWWKEETLGKLNVINPFTEQSIYMIYKIKIRVGFYSFGS